MFFVYFLSDGCCKSFNADGEYMVLLQINKMLLCIETSTPLCLELNWAENILFDLLYICLKLAYVVDDLKSEVLNSVLWGMRIPRGLFVWHKRFCHQCPGRYGKGLIVKKL